MAAVWTPQRVEALAPDSASVVAGRKLAKPGPWAEVGHHGTMLWGRCQGSGKTPYQVSVDTEGPRYTCTCPSRKLPCKHVLALLFMWTQGQINEDGAVAAFASEWAAKADAPAPKPTAEPKEQTAEQRAAAEARAAQREDWVSSGLAELERFLDDQVREGLAARAFERGERLDRIAARMVDAQAPGVANWLRELAVLPSVGDWPDRVVDAYGSLHLLARAWERRSDLPPDLLATVRSRIGFATRTDDVRALPGVRDRWVVIGMRDADEELVSVRRVWLWGRDTGARALVLFFARTTGELDASLLPGTEVDADVHFYPGRAPLRGILGTPYAEAVPVRGWQPEPAGVEQAVADLRGAVAADPWLDALPAKVTGRMDLDGSFWFGDGACVALTGADADLWRLYAEVGTDVTTVFGELGAEGLRPTSYLVAGELRVL